MLGKVRKFLAFMIASFFGVGYVPFASGTFGSIAAFLLIVPVIYFYGEIGIIILAVVSFLFGTIAVKKVLKYTKHDPSFVVIDEVCGQAIACIPMAFGVSENIINLKYGWKLYFVMFLLFRLFDITKPLFIGRVDRNMRNAFGVMLDDVLAGVCAAILFIAFIFSLMIWSAMGISFPFIILMLILLLWAIFKICWKLV